MSCHQLGIHSSAHARNGIYESVADTSSLLFSSRVIILPVRVNAADNWLNEYSAHSTGGGAEAIRSLLELQSDQITDCDYLLLSD